ncbi:SAM-dependent methyltransferase [Candidatus Trichorickettsia mobilis]|uniref:SAM-dependent methyltransferase n=1 Tax=Candidatus Trichorickettsia mobilis TaxID=1346319 RepID=A0ABZ0UQW9_9RICK|nr:SAM-dependent methyltransferase [Candidatus Trichorickettsia mobilis]WPY00216.1 SAM-dependent methyltransferase [Candidatus Trichorickettsia mobilis]
MPIDSTIRDLIQRNGYITVEQMMHHVLAANPGSYYQQQAILGESGDFITAPEVSQIFGEIIGIWCVEQWYKLKCPTNISIVELGPGRGLLMRDLLRTVRLIPEFYNNVNIQLVEINQNFIKLQKENLSKFDINIKWLPTIYEIEDSPTLIIANEFFDALPIKQYIKLKEDWYEIILIVDPHDGKIKFDKISMHKELQSQLAQDHINAHDGAVIEESPESLAIIRFIGDHFKKHSGASLIIDYGYDIKLPQRNRSHYNSTLQAIKKHQYHPLLESLGEADLSAHVDFNALKNTAFAHELTIDGCISQAEFLIKYGILERADRLRNNLAIDEKHIIDKQVQRLIAPSQMGNLFKVLALSSLDTNEVTNASSNR